MLKIWTKGRFPTARALQPKGHRKATCDVCLPECGGSHCLWCQLPAQADGLLPSRPQFWGESRALLPEQRPEQEEGLRSLHEQILRAWTPSQAVTPGFPAGHQALASPPNDVLRWSSPPCSHHRELKAPWIHSRRIVSRNFSMQKHYQMSFLV